MFWIATGVNAQDAQDRKQPPRRPADPRSRGPHNYGVAPRLSAPPSIGSVQFGTWTPMGPAPVQESDAGNSSGRLTGIAVDPTDDNTIYVAAATGGVWKTTDGGLSWTPLTDTQQSLSMGAIAVAPNRHQRIYAGTGEANDTGNAYAGVGILVSDDGGASWTLRGSDLFRALSVFKIVVDPTNYDVAYAATTNRAQNGGTFDQPSGIFKTTDGGLDWTNVSNGIPNGNGGFLATGLPFSDVVIDPHNHNILYAARWIIQGSVTNGIYRSTNAGEDWVLLSGAPNHDTTIGRTALAAGFNNSTGHTVLYAAMGSVSKMVSDKETGLQLYKMLRSDNADVLNPDNVSFTDLTANTPNFGNEQTNFAWVIGVDPANPAAVYAGGTPGEDSNGKNINIVIRSGNSGVTWTDLTNINITPHADQHAIAFDSKSRMLAGNDGGVWRYDPATNQWTNLNSNLNTIQFYSLGQSPDSNAPTTAIGGSQDNGTPYTTGSMQWTDVTGGDGGVARIGSNNRCYATLPLEAVNQDGSQVFSASTTGCTKAALKTASSPATADTKNINSPPPLWVDPTNTEHVFLGAGDLWESSNHGSLGSWTSRGNPAPGQSIKSFAVLPDKIIYMTMDDQSVWVSTNGGAGWTASTVAASKPQVDEIDIDPNDSSGQTAVAVVSNTSAVPIYRTTNGGQSWQDISGNLPHVPTYSAKIDTDAGKTIYVGNANGVYTSASPYTTWTRYGTGLPNVMTFALQLSPDTNILAAATHGRGAWYISTRKVPATIAEAIAPASILSGGTATITLTLTNPNAGASLSALSFSDTLSGMFAIAGSVRGTCAGTTPSTLTAGQTILSFSGISLAGGSSCTVVFDVSSTTPGPNPNSTSGVSSTDTRTGQGSNTATLTVVYPPRITAAFSAATMPAGGTTTLTLTLSNLNSFDFTGANFTGSLASFLSATGGSVGLGGGACAGTTPSTLLQFQTALSFTGITIPANRSCTVSFTVSTGAPGVKSVTVSGVSTDQNVTGTGATASVTSVVPIGIAEAFSPSTIASGASTQVVLTLSNSNGVSVTNASFTDTLSSMSAVAGSQGGSCLTSNPATLLDGQTSLSFSGITVPAGGCTVVFHVTSTTVGTVTNQTSGVSSPQTATGSASNVASLAVTPPPVLSITKGHSGNFPPGQSGTYTVNVQNTGTVSTTGTVIVTEAVPVGMTLASMSGANWSCPTGGTTCSRSDALGAGASYPAITVSVNVSATAPSPLVNSVSVSGGGAAKATATDSTIIAANTSFWVITGDHPLGNFTQGQTGAFYRVYVSNAVGKPTTSGLVTVTESAPAGLTLTRMVGTGWTCPTGGNTCTRSDALTGGSTYPELDLFVDVAWNATSPLLNSVSVSGGGATGSATFNDSTIVIPNPPVLSIRKSHTGSFTQGQNGATYNITVSNAAGTGPTSGSVTVTDTVPAGMTLVSLSGTGWTCPGNTCTRSDALTAGSSYPSITATVNVAFSAGATLVNSVSVSGGGSATAAANDSTTINANPPVLSIAKSHTGNFTQGQNGATYSIVVSNAQGAGPTSGTVTVTDTAPTGMTLVSLSGTGWTCPGGGTTCTRIDPLSGGSSYPAITATVNVAANAGSPLSNRAAVSGGGSSSSSIFDSTAIFSTTPVLSIAKRHSGAFLQGQNGAYTITVSNAANAVATSGTVTVTESVPNGMALVSMSGNGWTCPNGGVACTRSDPLSSGSSYPDITATVSVSFSAGSSLSNSVSVAGGGSAGAIALDSTLISANPPLLSIAKTHSGDFLQGQLGATYTVVVSNMAGAGPTSGTITVTDAVPIITGMQLVSMAGTGWTCPGAGGAATCSRSDSLSGGASYPPITVTVNVAPASVSPVVNAATVTGGGSLDANASDSTNVLTNAPSLSLTKTHIGNFQAGQNGATYTVILSNQQGALSTGGSVNITEVVPSGMTLVSMAGDGWTCISGTSCVRRDALAGGSSFPPITVTVNVAANATSPQVNTVSAAGSGGGHSVTATANDSTIIGPSPPILSISKTHSGSFTQGQNSAAYTISVQNYLTASPTSGTVTVTETVPVGMTLISMSGTGWTCPPGGNTCSRSDTLTGGSIYPSITALVNVAANAGSPLINNVSVSGGGSASATTTDSTVVNINPAVLSIAKSHSGSFTQGQNGATYTITVSNGVGAGPTSGVVTVADVVPAGMTLVSMAGTGWTCPGGNTCTRSDALAGGGSYPSLTATVNVSLTAGSTLSNSASVSGGGSAGASASDSTTINPAPSSLSITATHTGNFTQGQSADATITVSNASGAGPTFGTVTVVYHAPIGLHQPGPMSGSGWTCTFSQCTRTDSLAAGSSYPPITATFTVDTTVSSPLINQATVSGGGSPSATVNDSVTINSAAVLSITSSHGGNAIQGQSFQYTVVVKNTGTGSTIGDITITEALPIGLTLVSMTGPNWTCPAGGNACTSSQSLTPGNTSPLTVNVKADLTATSPLVNSVTVSGGGAPSASITDSIVISVAAPNLTISKSHTGNFTQGQTGIYTITVLNDANAPVVGLTSGVVTVTDTTPAGMTLSSMSGAGWTCAPGGNTCTRSDVLSPGSTYPPITATVTMAANAAASLANSASVSGGGSSSTRTANDNTTINPSAASLSIAKSHTSNFTQGQNGATYTIVVSNAAGVGPTSGIVTVTETVPAGMTLVSMAGTNWNCTGVTCTRSDVLNGGSSYPAITATVNVDPVAASPLVNIASVSGGGSNTATATDSTTINPNGPLLGIAKSHAGNFQQGQKGATYAVTVSNTAGAGPTTGTVTVTESAPAGMTLASMAGPGWSCAAASCTRTDTLPGGSSYPSIVVTVNVAANASSPLVNSVSVSGGGSVGASTTDSTTIGGNPPVLSIAKSHSGSFTQGQNGTYTLTVSNGGGAGSTSGAVTVTESVPAGMTLVSMAGSGWTCPGGGNTCTRADALTGGSSYPSIAVTVSVAANATSPQVNSVAVSGGGAASTGATDSTVILASPTVSVTLQTTPAGLSISADGTAYTAPQTFSWAAGSQHTIAAATQGAGTRYVFSTWSDSGAAGHTINAPAAGGSATYTATFSTQYLLTATALPANGGSVSASPSSGDGYYAPGTTVQVTAQPATGYSFSGYSGAVNNGINPQAVTMSQPQTVSAAFTSVGVAPAVVSVTPSSGSGAVQNFTAVYNAANGYQDLQWVQMLIAVATDGGGQSYCYVHYDVAGNGLWLYSDVVGFFLGPIAPGTASNRLQGSACALNTSGSSVVKNGTSLTLNVSVVFKAAGARNVYLRAMNLEGNDTNWVQRGSWSMTAAALQTPTVSPASGSGTTQTFTLTYPDPPGFAGAAFGWVQFLVAAASNGGGQPFCYVHYDRGGNGLWMYSGDVGYFVGPVTPGTASNALSSSACSINTAGATVNNTNGNLVVTVPITMKAPMNGSKFLFQRTLDVLSRDTGWVQSGSWTVQ